MKKKPPPKKGAAPQEEQSAPSQKTVFAWCEGCHDKRPHFGGCCLVCGAGA
jgi:hypothetical protein